MKNLKISFEFRNQSNGYSAFKFHLLAVIFLYRIYFVVKIVTVSAVKVLNQTSDTFTVTPENIGEQKVKLECLISVIEFCYVGFPFKLQNRMKFKA